MTVASTATSRSSSVRHRVDGGCPPADLHCRSRERHRSVISRRDVRLRVGGGGGTVRRSAHGSPDDHCRSHTARLVSRIAISFRVCEAQKSLVSDHDVAQPLSDRSIRKSPSFLQTLFAAQSHGVLSVASASVRDCGRACVSRRCAFARGASRGSSPQVRASTRIIHRRGAPALSQALSRRRRRDGQPERASFDRDR